MSRCYPFPPPGYIRNAPLELELPAKKEKRKHKDKKKKKKRHSATNNDLIIQDKDTPLEEIQESGLGFKAERARSPETQSALPSSPNQGVIQRLQNKNPKGEVVSNCVLATNLERPKERSQLHKLKTEGPPNGVLVAKAERFHADRSREDGVLGTDGKKSKQSMQANLAKPTAEVLANGMLAMPNKRLKVENQRENMLSNGFAASSWKRPEQGLQADTVVNEMYSNGVLSTKRKRLQADHHGDKLQPSSSVPANDCRRSQQGSQAGNSKNEVFLNDVPATSNMRLHTDRSSDKFFSKAIPPERAEQSLRTDSSSFKMTRDGVQAVGFLAGSGNGKELSQHLRASSSRFQADKPNHEVSENGPEADNLRVKVPSNYLLGSRGGRSDPTLQAGTKITGIGVRDSSVRSSQAMSPSENVLSGAMLTTNCRRSEQSLLSDRSTKEAAPNGVLTAGASTKKVQAGKAGAIPPVVRAATNEGAEQRLQARSSRQEVRAKGVLVDAARLQTDNSPSKILSHGVVVTGQENCEQRLQETQVKKDMVSNGAIAGPCEELAAKVKVKSPLAGRATSCSDAAVVKDVAPALRGTSECNDEIVQLFRPLARRPLIEPPADDEDWLLPCHKELQSNAREKWDTQIPKVWEEAVLLPVVGIHALPYVITD